MTPSLDIRDVYFSRTPKAASLLGHLIIIIMLALPDFGCVSERSLMRSNLAELLAAEEYIVFIGQVDASRKHIREFPVSGLPNRPHELVVTTYAAPPENPCDDQHRNTKISITIRTATQEIVSTNGHLCDWRCIQSKNSVWGITYPSRTAVADTRNGIAKPYGLPALNENPTTITIEVLEPNNVVQFIRLAAYSKRAL